MTHPKIYLKTIYNINNVENLEKTCHSENFSQQNTEI